MYQICNSFEEKLYLDAADGVFRLYSRLLTRENATRQQLSRTTVTKQPTASAMATPIVSPWRVSCGAA